MKYLTALYGLFLLIPTPAPALAQQQPTPAVQPPAQPVPDRLELHRLIWSSMAAIHHANISGNYSVLRDIGSTGFQLQFSAAQLAGIFQGIREEEIDLSNSLLLAPELTSGPQIVSPGVMRVRGVFGLRPTALAFDIFYQWQGGEWRLYGIDIQPRDISSVQPAADAR